MKIKKRFKIMLKLLMTFTLLVMGIQINGVTKLAAAKNNVTQKKLSGPAYDAAGNVVWDCIYFGNYWQSDTNGDGVADKKDKKEPIKWRVLSVKGTDAFLIADKNLDCQKYNATYLPVTWAECTLRSWLNGYDSRYNLESMNYSKKTFVDESGTHYPNTNFIDAAFTEMEQKQINVTTVFNTENIHFKIQGGIATADKIYLLSISEVSDATYGFQKNYNIKSDTRVALNTTYAGGQKSSADFDRGSWWLRTPGYCLYDAACVSTSGCGDFNGYYVDDAKMAIRPVLHLNVSDTSCWSYAGTIQSKAGKLETPPISIYRPDENTIKATPVPGQKIEDSSSEAVYKILSVKASGASVEYLRPEGKGKEIYVPDTVSYGGKKYKVTSIAKGAFTGKTKIKTVILGKHIKSIGKNAFKNCRALSKVTVKSTRLSMIGKNAFKGTSKKLIVKVPKQKKGKYKKMFKGKGNKKLRVK